MYVLLMRKKPRFLYIHIAQNKIKNTNNALYILYICSNTM